MAVSGNKLNKSYQKKNAESEWDYPVVRYP